MYHYCPNEKVTSKVREWFRKKNDIDYPYTLSQKVLISYYIWKIAWTEFMQDWEYAGLNVRFLAIFGPHFWGRYSRVIKIFKTESRNVFISFYQESLNYIIYFTETLIFKFEKIERDRAGHPTMGTEYDP